MPSGNCVVCRQFSVNLDNKNRRCLQCRPKLAADTKPEPTTDAPNNRVLAFNKRVKAELELAVRIGGSCGVCRFSVMSDRLRCHRMPPGGAGGHWDFPSVMPFSSCGEFVLQPELSNDGEAHFGESADGDDQVRQRLNLAGMGNFAGAAAGEVAETAAYLWYFNQVQEMYTDAAGIGDVRGNTEDSGNFLQDLFGL